MSEVRDFSVISYYLDKWESILNEVKYISTVDLQTLFQENQENISTFKTVLIDLQGELLLDYQKYLLNYFHTEESALSIINRVLFYALWNAITRLYEAIQNANHHRYEYLYKLNIPPAKLFHDNIPPTLAELIRHIHIMTVDDHCTARLSKVHTNTPIDQLQESENPSSMLLCITSKKVNDLLCTISILYSYPSIPIYARGHLVSSEIIKEPQLPLLKLPNYNNIICSACKINNLEYGITDDIEQKDKLRCNCVFIQSNIINQTLPMHVSTIRSQIIQRMAFLHSHICECYTHTQNCIQDMENIEKILPTKIVNMV